MLPMVPSGWNVNIGRTRNVNIADHASTVLTRLRGQHTSRLKNIFCFMFVSCIALSLACRAMQSLLPLPAFVRNPLPACLRTLRVNRSIGSSTLIAIGIEYPH